VTTAERRRERERGRAKERERKEASSSSSSFSSLPLPLCSFVVSCPCDCTLRSISVAYRSTRGKPLAYPSLTPDSESNNTNLKTRTRKGSNRTGLPTMSKGEHKEPWPACIVWAVASVHCVGAALSVSKARPRRTGAQTRWWVRPRRRCSSS